MSMGDQSDSDNAGKSQVQYSLFTNEDDAKGDVASSSSPKGRFSNFVVYVDESGDHGLQNIDPNYPVFVLAFCVFYKRHYSEKVVPALQKFKFNHFGHDHVVLHENEIRKEKGIFKFVSEQHRVQFLDELTGIIEVRNFVLIACVIDIRTSATEKRFQILITLRLAIVWKPCLSFCSKRIKTTL